MAATETHFLDAEDALLARLRESCPDARAVGSVADMAAMEQRQQTTPALYVLYDGYTPGEDVGRGSIQRITQRWLVICAVRHVAAPQASQSAREDGGRLLSQVLAALQGWSPQKGRYSPLRLAAAPPPEYQAGFGYLPTAWDMTLTTRGEH
ncbi:MAG: hypothetical protein ACLFSR_03890 [Halomonas sp.]